MSKCVDKGEMSFEIFDYREDEILELTEASIDNLSKVRALSELLGESKLPRYLIEYIKNFCPAGDSSIAVHGPKSIEGSSDADHESITRAKGFIGTNQLELGRYPNAIHHIIIFHNGRGRAKVFYKYHGNVRFLKSVKKK